MNNYFTNVNRTVSTASCTYAAARKADTTFDSDFPKKTNLFKFANGPRFLPRLSSLVTNQSAFQHLSHAHIHTLIRNFVFLYVAQGITGDSIHQPPDHWLISSQIFQPFLFYIYKQRMVQFSIESFERCCFSGGLVEYLTQLLLAAMEAAMVRVLHSASMLQLVLQCVLERFLTLQMLSRPQICSVLGCLTRKGGEEKAFVAFSDSADNFPQSTSS